MGNQLSFGTTPDNITCQRCRKYSMLFISNSRKNLLPSMTDVLQVCFWNTLLTLHSKAVFAGTDAMLFDYYQHWKMDGSSARAGKTGGCQENEEVGSAQA